MAVDLIRSRLLWSRLESRAPALDACRLDPAQGGLGDAPAAAPRSRCRLRSGESASPTSSSSCRIVARPHTAAASIAAACGVDPGASPETPTRLSGSLATPTGCPRSAHRGGCPIRKTCATCGGAGVVCESGSRRGPRPVRRHRRARPAPGAGRTETAWRGGAIIATASRVAIVRSNGAWTATTTAGLAQGKVDDRHGRQRRVRRARVLRTDRGGPGAAW